MYPSAWICKPVLIDKSRRFPLLRRNLEAQNEVDTFFESDTVAHMKSNGLASALTGAVMVCALTTGWVSVKYFFSMREWQKLQVQYATMTTARSAAQALANDAIEYSKRNTNIDGILYRFDIKSPPGTNRPPAAAANPRPPQK
jgi:hypothetical protein